MKRIYITFGGNMFILATWIRSGQTDKTPEELEAAIASFRVFE